VKLSKIDYMTAGSPLLATQAIKKVNGPRFQHMDQSESMGFREPRSKT